MAGSLSIAGCTGETSTPETDITASPTQTANPTKTSTATSTATESPTETPAPAPDVIGAYQEAATDSWNTRGHDPNRSRYNPGTKLFENKPEFQQKLSLETSSTVFLGNTMYFRKSHLLDSQVWTYNIHNHESTLAYKSTITPLQLTENYLFGEILQTFHAIERSSGKTFYYNPEDDSGYLWRAIEHANGAVVVWENLIIRLNSEGEVLWKHRTGRTTSYLNDMWFLKDAVLLKTQDGKWRELSYKHGKVVQDGSYILSEIEASRLPVINHEVPVKTLEGDGSAVVAYTPEVVFSKEKYGPELTAKLVETGRELWSVSVSKDLYAVADNKVLIGDGDRATALNANTGREQWSVEIADGGIHRVIPVGNRLLVNNSLFN